MPLNEPDEVSVLDIDGDSVLEALALIDCDVESHGPLPPPAVVVHPTLPATI